MKSTHFPRSLLCRNPIQWKTVIIMVSFISLLWGIILFVLRAGGSEDLRSFCLLAGMGLGIDLLNVYIALLRQWAKTWIENGVIYSDMTLGSLVPISLRMSLTDLESMEFVYNGQIYRKGLSYPNAKYIKEMKDHLAKKIEATLASGHLPKPVSMENEKYRLTLNCVVLLFLDRQQRVMRIYLNMMARQPNLTQVGKFLGCMPDCLSYTWRFGKIGVHTFRSGI